MSVSVPASVPVSVAGIIKTTRTRRLSQKSPDFVYPMQLASACRIKTKTPSGHVCELFEPSPGSDWSSWCSPRRHSNSKRIGPEAEVMRRLGTSCPHRPRRGDGPPQLALGQADDCPRNRISTCHRFFLTLTFTSSRLARPTCSTGTRSRRRLQLSPRLSRLDRGKDRARGEVISRVEAQEPPQCCCRGLAAIVTQ